MKYLNKFEYFSGWNKSEVDSMIEMIKKVYIAKTYSFNKRFKFKNL
jgi:hypothetical protein